MQDKKRIFIETKEFVPEYGSEGAAGFDLKAYLPDGDVVIKPMQRMLIPTGIKGIIPEGYEVQARPRSGLSVKHGITLINAPGTIDDDYRGEWGVPLINLSTEKFTITHGMRLCQGILSPVSKGLFETIDEVPLNTKRGAGGYGSTGTH